MPPHPTTFPLSKVDTLICFMERYDWDLRQREDSPSTEIVDREMTLLTLLLIQEWPICGSK